MLVISAKGKENRARKRDIKHWGMVVEILGRVARDAFSEKVPFE